MGSILSMNYMKVVVLDLRIFFWAQPYPSSYVAATGHCCFVHYPLPALCTRPLLSAGHRPCAAVHPHVPAIFTFTRAGPSLPVRHSAHASASAMEDEEQV
jgi:hypothetical protein